MALTDNLILYYGLNETSGTTAVDSVGTSNATNYNATINQTGKLGTAYSFNGTTSYLNNTYSSSLTVFSVSVWIYYQGTAAFVVAKDVNTSRGWGLGVSTGHLYLESNGTNLGYGTTTLVSGNWYHLVMTSDGSNVKGYVNNNLDLTTTGTFNTNSDTISIGRRNYPGAEGYFTGLIDEVGIWSRVLTTTDISQLYNSGAGYSPYPTPSGSNDDFYTMSLGAEF